MWHSCPRHLLPVLYVEFGLHRDDLDVRQVELEVRHVELDARHVDIEVLVQVLVFEQAPVARVEVVLGVPVVGDKVLLRPSGSYWWWLGPS